MQRVKDFHVKEGRPNLGHYKHRMDLPSLEELQLEFEDWKVEAGEAVAAAREVVVDQVSVLESEGVIIGLHDLSSDSMATTVGFSSAEDGSAAPISLVRLASLMEADDALQAGLSNSGGGAASPKTPNTAHAAKQHLAAAKY